MEILQTISDLLTQVRSANPLIHQITNTVTINDCANITLALGGSPVMASDETEAEEMVSHANALVLNIGTLNRHTVNAMLLAGKAANRQGIPVILDPVGVGATELRTNTARRIIKEVQIAVIRGNLSEISVLTGLNVLTRGVDAVRQSCDSLANEINLRNAKNEAFSTEISPGTPQANPASPAQIAETLARQLNCIIAITGPTDTISEGQQTCTIANGHPLLAKVTGTGCMSTALIATFCGVTHNHYLATIAGILTMNLAGELAHQATCPKNEQNVGSFRVNLFDQLANLTANTIKTKANLSIQNNQTKGGAT